MYVASITGPHQGRLLEKPDPRAVGNVAVVKIIIAPMCTEYYDFSRGNVNDRLGHEAAGEVVEVAQPGRVKVGDRVFVMPQYPCGACELCGSGDYIHCLNNVDVLKQTGNEAGTATFAQYILKQDWLLLPIPDAMSYEHAAMACCGMGPTFGAMQRMAVDAFDTVIITGMGPVGLGGVINGVQRGAKVIAVESNPYRADLARKLGAAAVIDPNSPDAEQDVLRLTHGRGADKGIETSGRPEPKGFLLKTVRRKGQVALVGWNGQIDASTMIAKGLTLHGVWHWNLRDANRLMAAIAASPSSIDQLITHKFSLEQVQDAWKVQLTNNCGKVLLYPWGVSSDSSAKG